LDKYERLLWLAKRLFGVEIGARGSIRCFASDQEDYQALKNDELFDPKREIAPLLQ
jgi:hypothetical protein